MKVNNSKKPGTAVVTGASSGIGKVYAERLAARGYDLILIARREDRLQAIANDLEKRFAIKPDVFVADLSQPAGLAAAIARINTDSSLSFLVNNAGFSALRPLSDTPLELINSMIAINITALTALSKTALVRFRERNAGVIVNVGSGVGFAPYPDVPVYGPTKAYVLQFFSTLSRARGFAFSSFCRASSFPKAGMSRAARLLTPCLKAWSCRPRIVSMRRYRV